MALIAGGLVIAACGSGEQNQVAASTPDPATPPPQVAEEASTPERESQGRAVISEEMPYAEVGDELVYGYFVAPSDMFEPLPAVLMIHEWWGLTDEMRARADRLAAQGFIVLAVDLFGGRTASNPAAARNLMLSVAEDPESANENIRGAFEFVSETAGAPRVGSIGWRFGGTWALNTAFLFPEDLDAAVIYYAQVTSDEDKLRPVNAPILGLFAADDISIKIDSVEAFKNSLESLRKEYDIQVYAGVGQRFSSASASNYDARAADDAWNRMLDFFSLHLAGDGTAGDGS
ncbi:MAG: dienelactone hydrolase family protein [Woeseiaceae bacterium]